MLREEGSRERIQTGLGELREGCDITNKAAFSYNCFDFYLIILEFIELNCHKYVNDHAVHT